jgi:hypothetical protein
MKSHQFWSILTVVLFIGALLSMVLYARADCSPADIGTVGNDNIICTITNFPGGTFDVQGLEGDDTIVIDNGVNTGVDMYGDSSNAGVSGNDTIINNGNMSGSISGDSGLGNNSGNDVIVNNGTSNTISGDGFNGTTNSGSDTITNNGTVNGSIAGDTVASGDATGSDTITNNGNVNGDIYGDGNIISTGGGNDTINNNGNINGGIYGDGDASVSSGNDTVNNSGYVGNTIDTGNGNDTVNNSGYVGNTIDLGAGDDTMTITGNGYVGGVIEGGSGYDTLNFNLATSDPEELQAIAQQIAAANPAGGTLTIRGIVYTWQNFEQLSTLLLSLVRVNGVGDPLAVFCALGGGIDVYAVVGNQGILSLSVSAQALSNASANAQENGVTVNVAHSSTSVVYALASGEIQVNAPNGFDFTFNYQSRCGELPEAGTLVVEEVETDTFTIINRPR